MRRALALTVIVLSLGLVAAHESPSMDGDDAGSKKLVSAWKGDLRVSVDLEGRILPRNTATIALWPKEYRGELRVLEVRPHGSLVNEGDVLVRLDTTPIDRQIDRARFALKQAERNLQRQEEKAGREEEAAAAGLASAEKESDWAARRLAGYRDKEKPFNQETVRLQNQSSQHGLDDQRDELKELEKMYNEDELVDATEEIVLKRARRRLASSIAWANLNQSQREYQQNQKEAMHEEQLAFDAQQKQAALGRLRPAQAAEHAAREDALAKMRFDLDNQRQSLTRLEQDRDLFVIRAPRGGILLHGKADAAPGQGIIERGETVPLFKTILTVADPEAYEVTTEVPEPSLPKVQNGLAAKVTAPAAPGFETMGSLDVATIASGRRDGTNLYRAHLAINKKDARLRPGMQCKVSVVVTDEENAVLIPKSAVVRANGSAHVRCSAAGGAIEDRAVVLGPADDHNVVVRQGLSAGDKVVVLEEKAKKEEK